MTDLPFWGQSTFLAGTAVGATAAGADVAAAAAAGALVAEAGAAVGAGAAWLHPSTNKLAARTMTTDETNKRFILSPSIFISNRLEILPIYLCPDRVG
jgi:hypothetical protein